MSDIKPLLDKIHEKSVDQLDDVATMLQRQSVDTDREALLRPSVVIGITIVGKISIARQTLSLLHILQPDNYTITQRLQSLQELDNLRESINNRRRQSISNPIVERLSRFADAMAPCPGNARLHGVIQHVIRDMSVAYANADAGTLALGEAFVDRARIVKKFTSEAQIDAEEVGGGEKW